MKLGLLAWCRREMPGQGEADLLMKHQGPIQPPPPTAADRPPQKEPIVANKILTVMGSIGASFAHGISSILRFEKQVDPLVQVGVATLAAVNPAAGATLETILAEVGTVEQVATAVGASTGTGTQKLIAAIPGVEKLIFNDPLFRGKVIVDRAKFDSGIKQLTSGVHDIADAFRSATVKPDPTPAAIAPAAAVPVH